MGNGRYSETVLTVFAAKETETVKTVSGVRLIISTRLKPGVNEKDFCGQSRLRAKKSSLKAEL